jgi:hypothetical protein
LNSGVPYGLIHVMVAQSVSNMPVLQIGLRVSFAKIADFRNE